MPLPRVECGCRWWQLYTIWEWIITINSSEINNPPDIDKSIGDEVDAVAKSPYGEASNKRGHLQASFIVIKKPGERVAKNWVATYLVDMKGSICVLLVFFARWYIGRSENIHMNSMANLHALTNHFSWICKLFQLIKMMILNVWIVSLLHNTMRLWQLTTQE